MADQRKLMECRDILCILLHIINSADISALRQAQYMIIIIRVTEKKAIACHTKKELTVSQF